MKEEGFILKRDMELVRRLLIEFSEGKSQMQFITSTFNDETQKHLDDRKYEYHMKIMQQEGLITYKAAGYKGGFYLLNVPELTWKGQDYLSAIEDDTTWNRTKEGLATKGLELGKITFDTLFEFAKMKAKEMLGI